MCVHKYVADQQFVEILDVIRFQQWKVSRGLIIHLLGGAVLRLHVEACHASNRCRSGRQLARWCTNRHIACWWRQDLLWGGIQLFQTHKKYVFLKI